MKHRPGTRAAGAESAMSSQIHNQVLGALPQSDQEAIAPQLERVTLAVRDLLYDVNQVIDYVYFPETCVASIIGVMADGTAVETATVGDEGVVGLPVFHGTDRTSTQAFCQVGGEALRMPAGAFRDAYTRSESLKQMLHLYSQALFTLVAQSSACNRLHSMQQRCARWLLHTHDRVGHARGVAEFPLTQQFLSQMIGVRRATVTAAMSAIQETGSISYEMGRIMIRDRGRLESVACECYAIVRSEFDRLLQPTNGRPSVPSPLSKLKTSEGGKTLIGDAVPPDDHAAGLD